MNKSKLILLLKTFSAEEIKRFTDFLSSPYYNKNKTIVKYLQFLKKHYPQFRDEKLSKEKVYKHLFPGKAYNEQVMRNLTSDMNMLCKEFLSTEFTRNNLFEHKLGLLLQLIQKKSDSVYKAELNIFEEELRKVSQLSENNFYYLFRLEEAKISYHLEKNEQPLVFDKVMKSGEHLILFFLLNLTKTISNLNVNKQSFNVDYHSNLPQKFFDSISIPDIIKYMKEHGIEFSETAELYFYRVLCNTHPYDENHFYKFKELTLSHLTTLNRTEIYGLFNAMETFCLIKINSGKSEFVKELFDLFNTEIDKGFYKFSDTSPLTYMKFRNTFIAAVSLGKLEWITGFMERFKRDLIDDHRDNIIAIAEAQLDFERGRFENVLEKISQIKTSMVYLKIDLRNLTLMSYYELGYIESVITSIDSYRHFLSVNKSITEVFKNSHLRFLNSLSSLINFKEKGQTDELMMLKEKLLPFRNERRIGWLIDRITEAAKKN